MLEIARKIEGFMLPEELVWLATTVKGMKRVVEIGSWCGRSACAIAEGLGSGGEVVCVDPWEDRGHLAQFRMNVGSLPKDFGKVTELVMTSKKARKLITTADMVFIDGLHEYGSCKEDIELWNDVGKKIIAGHDYGKPDGEWEMFREWPGVKQAVDEFYGNVKVNHCRLIWWVEKS
jgi:hypothetical protein